MMARQLVMPIAERRLSWLIASLGALLLFLPKINLISVSGSDAGIRLDDAMLLGITGVIFIAHLASRISLTGMERWMLGITLYSLFAFCFNTALAHTAGIILKPQIFYALRLSEYFAFFYIGRFVAECFSLSRLLKAFVCWQGVLVLLQVSGIIGGFISGGSYSMVNSRVTGSTGHPTELGIVINILFCFLAFGGCRESLLTLRLGHLSLSLRTFYLLIVPFLLFMELTGSRIATVALLVVFIGKMWEVGSFRSLASLTVWGVCGFCVLVVALNLGSQSQLTQRGNHRLLSFQNIRIVRQVWHSVDIDGSDLTDMMDLELDGDASYDLSWWLRAHKWAYLGKAGLRYPYCLLFGFGPGAAGIAVDGGWLRVLIEYGLIGGLLFVGMLAYIARRNACLKWSIIALGINMIFIDAYLFYKPISLLFIIAGYSGAKRSIEYVN